MHWNGQPEAARLPLLCARIAETMLTANVRPVPEQISLRREIYPHSIALSYGDQHLNYEELDRSSHRFAAYLTQLGIVSGGAVAICMERSLEWIVAALGTMQAGAAYVPLDSAWPDSRLRFAVKDSGATVLVAGTELLDRLQVKARGIDPRRDATSIASTAEVALEPIQRDSLAYLIYTSGSTGAPKGVEITHANLSHLIRWHVDTFGITQQDRASHLAGLGFDAAGWEIWPHLCAGATVVCVTDDKVRSSSDLIQKWMIRERITIGFVPTMHAEPMMSMEWPPTTSLRFLLTGGDALSHGPEGQLPFEVVNNYGLTECSVVATSSVLKPGLQGAPPIGRPITGTNVYLLNEDGEQVPDGTAGEIYIGGGGVGRGYRNLPDLTQRCFVRNPFVAEPDARMYRTGDRGVCRPNGEIDFRGRLDRQTKIRGQRVELDEIGSILAQHPSIDFATAISISQAGENRLVAYVLPKESDCVPTSYELQSHLLGVLPGYMIPSIFIRLRALPLSPNGKLDLAMLPQPTSPNLLEQKMEKAPASPIEGKLLTMVRELLSNDEVSTEDSFFLAGGHSLLGMQLVMRVRERFGVNLTLRQLFEAPTVESLAGLVETMLIDSVDLRHSSIFWVQSRAVNLSKSFGNDQPLVCVALTEEDFESLGERPSLQSIATCLISKIRATQSKGPYTIGGFCLGGILAYEIAYQLRTAGQEVSLLVLLNAPNPSCLGSIESFSRKMAYMGYVVKRATRLGLQKTVVYALERVFKGFSHMAGQIRITKGSAHQLTEVAAYAYQPPKYDGNVLLLLASERPPHVNLAPGWQAVVTGDLKIEYLDVHHRDLLKTENVPRIADAIACRLAFKTGGVPVSCCAGTPEKTPRESPNFV
jgi:amino acid adenylation domain-containing protein